jgi:DNA-binding response OmpR family regulator
LEDERQLASAIREAFMEHQYEPIVVATVDEGIRELESRGGVDVIWLDHYLLGAGSGIDFVIELKHHPEWKKIPVFVVSNTASTTNVRSYIHLGVSNYYTKSDFDISQIIADIDYSLDRHE